MQKYIALEPWFAEKVALVTGGGDGIGRAGAVLFAQRGAKIVVVDIDEAAGERTVEEIVVSGGEAVFLRSDVSKPEDVQAMVRETVSRFGRLDCAFNNAGVILPADGEWDVEAFNRTVAVNQNGVMLCMKYQIAQFLEGGGGTIVNTASTSAFSASATVHNPAYTASKHAVVGLTRAAALQYARSNIRVNAICPGVTLTPMVRRVMKFSAEAKTALENYAPMGRLASPMEIAETAVWLASEKASFVNGHALVVDGGYLAQ